MRIALSTALCASFLTGAAFSQGTDDCASAQVITGTGNFNFDNTTATQDGAPDPACFKFGTSQIDADVWFSWTAPSAGDFNISTCGLTSIDSKLAVYVDGGACPPSPAIDCNDDTCGLQSTVNISGAPMGAQYLIRVGTFPGAFGGPGQFSIGTSVGGTPDSCSMAEVVSGCGLFNFDNTFASQDGLADPACFKFGTSQIDNDVWFSWTAPSAGMYAFETCNLTGVDTKMAIYADQGVCPPVGALDCDDDDDCTFVAGPSKVLATATLGQAFLIRLGTFPGAAGGTGQMMISGCGGTGVGQNYCVSTVNSTGMAATISATGSASISADDLTAVASNVPQIPGIGIFIASLSGQLQNPLFDGFLCVAPPVIRINVFTPPVGGTVTQAISMGSAPISAMVGDDLRLQHWFRDPAAAGTGANFTDGLEILGVTP